MSETAVRDEALRLGDGLFEVAGPIHREDGGELFVRELFADVDALYLADEYLCLLRHVDAGKRGDFKGALSDDRRVKRAVDDDRLAYLLRLRLVEEETAAVGKFFFNPVIYFVKDDDRLLGGADHAVVECF